MILISFSHNSQILDFKLRKSKYFSCLESTDTFMRLISQPIKTNQLHTFHHFPNSLWIALKMPKWLEPNRNDSMERIGNEVKISQEKEEKKSECIACSSYQVNDANQSSFDLECQFKSSSSGQVFPLIYGEKEAIFDEFLMVDNGGQQVRRRKVPIEINDKFFQNYFDCEPDAALPYLQYINLPTSLARSESEKLLADRFHIDASKQ